MAKGARVIGGDRLNKKLGAFARGLDLTAELQLAAEIPRQDYIERIQDITGSRQETRYNPKRVITVSDPGAAPNNDTGYLIAQTDIAPLRKNAVELYSGAEYAEHLEIGTSKMGARPALQPAYDATEKKVVAFIARAIARKMRSIINGR